MYLQDYKSVEEQEKALGSAGYSLTNALPEAFHILKTIIIVEQNFLQDTSIKFAVWNSFALFRFRRMWRFQCNETVVTDLWLTKFNVCIWNSVGK